MTAPLSLILVGCSECKVRVEPTNHLGELHFAARCPRCAGPTALLAVDASVVVNRSVDEWLVIVLDPDDAMRARLHGDPWPELAS